MNKKLIGSIVLTAGLMLAGSSLSSEAAAPKASAPVVMWGNMQLVKGQIGQVTILHDTPLYKLGSNKKMTFVRTLKKGSSYRVYSVRKFGGAAYYDVGAGYYVKASSLVKYETPPKAALQALGIPVTKETLQPGIVYPKISMLTSMSVETKMNHVFYNAALQAKKEDADLKRQEAQGKKDGTWPPGLPDAFDHLSYTVVFNQDNILSIRTDEYSYSGGAHGIDVVRGIILIC
jgi:hypothetical protein